MYFSSLRLIAVNVSSTHRPVPKIFIFLAYAVASLSSLSPARAVSPPPDGGYPGNNTAEGDNALLNLISGGFDNTAVGFDALASNTAGRYNTATGSHALLSVTDGVENTALGAYALQSSTGFFPSDNTAVGAFALENNQSGSNNTAIGADALLSSTTSSNNTATGFRALWLNTTGSNNTATGFQALGTNAAGNYTGSNNTATGAQALFSNTTAVGNTASGFQALLSNKTGFNNTADGRQALQNNTTGSFNIAVGNLAGRNLTTGGNNIDIGNQGVAAEAQTIRIGQQGNQNRTFLAGVFGSTASGGAPVLVNSTGRLFTATSSARFKEAIKPMDKASEAILVLKPVTFRYKEELDPEKIPQFGLIAEEVEKVNPDLVARDADGKVNTVRYEAVNAMLLNEFLKEHRRVEEQQATITRLESKVAKQELTATQQQKQIEALTATVQKVSNQVALSKPAPQLVANP